MRLWDLSIRHLLLYFITLSLLHIQVYWTLYDTDLDGAEKMVLAPGHEAAGLLEHALETQKYISK